MMASRLIGLFLLAQTAVTGAQVPLSKEPRHRVTFENAQLRILDFQLPAGDTTLDHRHEFDIATISVTSGSETRTQATGQPWGAVRPARPAGDASAVEYAGKPGSHRIENRGQGAHHLFAVENLRTSGWSPAPALSAPATTLTTDARAFRIYDVRLAAQALQVRHTHAVPTIVVLISGKAMSDGSDAQAKAFAPAPVGLRQLDRAGQWILVPPGDTHHLVRLGTSDAHIVEIEVR
jgi:quercetin dioxygenase-like cupin family protein